MNSPYLKKDCYHINVRNYSDMVDLLAFCRNRTKLTRQSYLNLVGSQEEINHYYQGCLVFKIIADIFSSRSPHAFELDWVVHRHEGIDLLVLRLILSL